MSGLLDRVLWLVLCSSIVGGDAPADCRLCGARTVLVCERCNGKGLRELPCDACAGERSVPCPVVGCEKGRLPCRPCGGGGEIHWETGAVDPCKVCGRKGSVDCGFCAGSGKVDCAACRRSGKKTVSCGACLGAGQPPCPRCPASRPCPACGGRRETACRFCLGKAELVIACGACRDWGLLFCKDCYHGAVACETCHGTGRRRLVLEGSGSRAGSQKCAACGGRGYEKCRACRDGVVPCVEPLRFEECGHCTGGRVPCTVCGGG